MMLLQHYLEFQYFLAIKVFFLLDVPPPIYASNDLLFVCSNEIKKVLLFPRTLPTTDQYPNTTLENVRTIIKSSYGLAAALLHPNSKTTINLNHIHLFYRLNHQWPINTDFHYF